MFRLLLYITIYIYKEGLVRVRVRVGSGLVAVASNGVECLEELVQ